jgi:phage terminase large subunit-like protein
VTIVPPQRSKQMRAQIQSAKFRDGRVLLPKEASFLAELETELLAFPKGRFDDRVDSICLALSYELPTYDLEKANAGFEEFVNTLAWQQQFWSLIK